MTHRLFNKVLLSAGFGLIAAGSAVAARAGSDVPTVVVRYSAASLSTDGGAQYLYRRLKMAAEEVCPDNSGQHWIRPEVRACRERALASAIEKVNSPRLVALYAANSKAS